jgi:ankyrin repeat protein
MAFARSWTCALLLTTLVHAAMMPAAAQVNDHTQFVESIRKAVKNPTRDHELYELVIQPEFVQTAQEAAKAGNDALVMELLQAYSGQASDKAKGGTALTWAAYYCDAPLLKILLDRGLNVNAKDADGDTPLHRALGVGRTDIVALLLEKHANVNSANNAGETPLMLAAADNKTENTRAFLDRHADVNARNKQGETPLMFAARNGRLENVKLLLSEGANVNLADHLGNTALSIAEKSPGAPNTSFHDFPGELDQTTAAKLAVQAKLDRSDIIQLLKRASDK